MSRIDTTDLLWLYNKHHIMIDGSAWLLAMMWENKLDPSETDLLSDPNFWAWYDRQS